MSERTFESLAKQNKFQVFATGVTMDLAEGIIDDSCLVTFAFTTPFDHILCHIQIKLKSLLRVHQLLWTDFSLKIAFHS